MLLWLPFIAAGGPANYLNNLATYQNDIFGVLSLNAWNPWALLQELGANGQFVSDRTSAFGPITFRLVGFVLAGLFALIVFVAVYRRPTPDQLALGIAAISLAAFVSLTTMHERYAYPALVFLLLALGRPAVAVAWIVFAVTFLLDLLVAVPPAGLDDPRAARSRDRWVDRHDRAGRGRSGDPGSARSDASGAQGLPVRRRPAAPSG